MMKVNWKRISVCLPKNRKLEENGRFYFENSAMLAFKRAEDAFAGEAQKAGFETEEDMQEYMKEIRKEVRGR